MELYNYQVDAVNKTDLHKKGIFVLPTGTGKTMIQAAILEKFIGLSNQFGMGVVNGPRIILTYQLLKEIYTYMVSKGIECRYHFVHSGSPLDIKDLEEDAFAAYKKKMAVLMKEKNKSTKKAKEDEMKKNMASIVEEVKASTDLEKSTTEVVDEVIDNSKLEKSSLPNSSTATDATVKEKYSRAFSFEEGFILNK